MQDQVAAPFRWTILLLVTLVQVGMFLVSPLFGLVADLTGSYAASWLGLAGWAVVGIVLGLLARQPREGAKS